MIGELYAPDIALLPIANYTMGPREAKGGIWASSACCPCTPALRPAGPRTSSERNLWRTSRSASSARRKPDVSPPKPRATTGRTMRSW
jgi:hypothetical protein